MHKHLVKGVLLSGLLLGTVSLSQGLAKADTIATQIDSKTARTNPGDVWEGSITFKGTDAVKNGSWEMVLTDPFADGADGYRYTVGHGVWDTRGGQDWVQRVGFKTLDNDYRGYLLTVFVKDENGKVIDTNSTGIDVSSDWTMFPRYGALTQFEIGRASCRERV